jgi:hypothetical protein
VNIYLPLEKRGQGFKTTTTTNLTMALAFRSGLHTEAQSDLQYPSTREEETKAIKELFPSPPKSESDAAVSSLTRTLEIPDPAIFAALENKTTNTDSHDPLLPSPAECAVHLELLEAFQILQQKVLTSNALDRVLGIVPKDTIVTVKGKRTRRPDLKFAQKRKVKWEIYLRFASARFLEWWTRLDEMLLATAREKGESGIIEESLPPLGMSTPQFSEVFFFSSFSRQRGKGGWGP